MSFVVETSSRLGIEESVEQVFDLGSQPLANALQLSSNDSEMTFPLSVSFCHKSKLLQLDQTVDRNILFSRYTWVTGTSKGAIDWAKEFVSYCLKTVSLNASDLILEVASNDGTYLQKFKAAGCTNILGVEPAANIAQLADRSGVPTIETFWDQEVAKDITREYGHAKLVIARNVIPHVSDLLGAVSGISEVLHQDGVAAIEFHYAGEILGGLQYDSIYHEHLCYFSIESITHLFLPFGLIPFHVVRSPISGGALVVYISKRKHAKSVSLTELIESERRSGVNDVDAWRQFSLRAESHRQSSIECLASFQDKHLIGFGSSARSQTFLNYCRFNAQSLSCIMDNNPRKQGMHAPGSRIPIVSVIDGLKLKPDLIFILAWNFVTEIVAECKAHGYKGQFLTAFPHNPRLFSAL